MEYKVGDKIIIGSVKQLQMTGGIGVECANCVAKIVGIQYHLNVPTANRQIYTDSIDRIKLNPEERLVEINDKLDSIIQKIYEMPNQTQKSQ